VPRPFVVTPPCDDVNSDLPAVNFWKDRKLSPRISRSCQHPVICRKVPTDRRTPGKEIVRQIKAGSHYHGRTKILPMKNKFLRALL